MTQTHITVLPLPQPQPKKLLLSWAARSRNGEKMKILCNQGIQNKMEKLRQE